MTEFNSEGFIVLADELSRSHDQARVRTAISRAYYGVFLFARSIAAVQSKHSDAHRLTQEYFDRIGATSVASMLKTMRALRNEADYNVSLEIPKDAA